LGGVCAIGWGTHIQKHPEVSRSGVVDPNNAEYNTRASREGIALTNLPARARWYPEKFSGMRFRESPEQRSGLPVFLDRGVNNEFHGSP
jgi:hypothetical protein